ncbi:MAG: MBOAT family protein [Microscillaceae bacterium]|jgi:D-alanyl-lipoteichoic acid acyltransferase DltB (MBOAT superfamily)|nr:MBOAT family protein [Microscillaceae bacterium]
MSFWESFFLYDDKNPMIFSAPYFWLFFGFIILVYQGIYQRIFWRNLFLLLMSFFFYYKSGGYFFTLLILSTVVDYYLSAWIYRSESKSERTFYLVCSLVINLGLLAYFKYAYFFTDMFNRAFRTEVQVVDYLAFITNQLFGSQLDYSRIILPVGISFYTFQTLSYTIDVYRRQMEPAKNIWDFAFFVSFFPQLVAGPIVRAVDFIPQIYQEYRLTQAEYGRAIFLIINGLIKKVLISDYISTNFVDRVFENPSAYTGFENLMAVYGYAIQIYCDFSGYTDMAIGLSLLLGFRLNTNFNSPYIATSITDFWRRWHISLSSWLRDYLYIPLGGNRGASVFTYLMLPIMLYGALIADGVTLTNLLLLLGISFAWLVYLSNRARNLAYFTILVSIGFIVWLGINQDWCLLAGLTLMNLFWLLLLYRPDLEVSVCTYANLSITMLLGGLWHGASLRFIIWGALHGVALAVHKLWLDATGSKNLEVKGWRKFVGQFITFHFVCFCWIYFRANDLTTVNKILYQITMSFNPQVIWQVIRGYTEVLSLLVIAFAIHWSPRRWKDELAHRFALVPDYAKALVIALIVIGLYQARTAEIQPFIYFQF